MRGVVARAHACLRASTSCVRVRQDLFELQAFFTQYSSELGAGSGVSALLAAVQLDREEVQARLDAVNDVFLEVGGSQWVEHVAEMLVIKHNYLLTYLCILHLFILSLLPLVKSRSNWIVFKISFVIFIKDFIIHFL